MSAQGESCNAKEANPPSIADNAHNTTAFFIGYASRYKCCFDITLRLTRSQTVAVGSGLNEGLRFAPD